MGRGGALGASTTSRAGGRRERRRDSRRSTDPGPTRAHAFGGGRGPGRRAIDATSPADRRWGSRGRRRGRSGHGARGGAGRSCHSSRHARYPGHHAGGKLRTRSASIGYVDRGPGRWAAHYAQPRRGTHSGCAPVGRPGRGYGLEHRIFQRPRNRGDPVLGTRHSAPASHGSAAVQRDLLRVRSGYQLSLRDAAGGVPEADLRSH